MRPGSDAAILRGYMLSGDAFVRAALERVLLAAQRAAVDDSTERFLSREWKEKAEEYRRERDALLDIISTLAAKPCAVPGPMSTCMDGLRSKDPDMWCRSCWARHVVRTVVLP